MNNSHIIYIPFTGTGLHGGYRGDSWFAHRIKIFRNYTLKSLANQSNKNFLLWITFRPEEEKNPLTSKIAEAIEEAGISYVFTFNGLMYWDDKFTNYTLKTKIRNSLMMLWDCWVYKEWKSPIQLLKLSWENKNKSLLERLSQSLQTLKEAIGSDFEWIYLTRIDSDDMFHKHTIDLIQSEKPKQRQALIFDKGYVYNIVTGQLGTWNPPTNPPFHTIIFCGNDFFDARRHLSYYQNFKSHEDIPRIFNTKTLDINSYMVSFHGKHISTGWESPLPRYIYQKIKYLPYCYTMSGRNISTRWKSRARKVRNFMIGEEIQEPEKSQILKDFGIDISQIRENIV